MLYYNTIYPKTLELLIKLQKEDIFADMRLVGGTGLALQLGHRISVDIDLFGTLVVDPISLNNKLSGIGRIELLNQTNSIHIYNIEGIKVDLVNYTYPWLQPAICMDSINMAAIEDIAAMKLSAICGRGRKKDFIDLYFILQRYSLQRILEFYEQKFSDGSIFQVLRSLSYFEDADEEPMPKMLINSDWDDIKKFISLKLKEHITKDINKSPL